MKLLRPFFFGIIAALGAFLLEFMLALFFPASVASPAIFFYRLTPLLIAAVLIEETFKFIFIRRSFEENGSGPKEQFFYGTLALGAGFSLFELFSALAGKSSSQDIPILCLSALGIVFVHVFTSGIIGYSFVKARSTNLAFATRTIFLAFVAHFLYNAAMIYSPAGNLQDVFWSFIISLK